MMKNIDNMGCTIICSDEVDTVEDALANFFAFHDLRVELGAFLGVLEDGGDLDASSPVAVVEALGEDQLLKMSLFKLASVGVNHLVVIGDDASFGGLLADNVEIVVFADDLSVDEGAWRNISGFISKSKESLAVSEVDHNHCDFHFEVVVG